MAQIREPAIVVIQFISTQFRQKVSSVGTLSSSLPFGSTLAETADLAQAILSVRQHKLPKFHNHAIVEQTYQTYVHRGQRMATDPACQVHLQRIVSVLLDVSGREFVVIDEPSGRGKTQLYFAATMFPPFTAAFDARYVVYNARAENIQYIYRHYQNESWVLMKCLALDWAMLQYIGCDLATLDGLRHPLWTAAFVAALFGWRREDSDSVSPLTVADLSDLAARTPKKNLLFIDEVPRLHHGAIIVNSFRLLRNLLQVVGVTPVLMGTDATTVNIASIPKDPVSTDSHWATVIFRLPPVCPAVLETLPAWAQLTTARDSPIASFLVTNIPNTNPLFAERLFEQLTGVPSLEELCEVFQKTLARVRGEKSFLSVRGQLALTSLTYLEDCCEEHATELVASHFARLCDNRLDKRYSSACSYRLLLNPYRGLVYDDDDSPWVRCLCYPLAKDDPLTHLMLLSSKPFVSYDGLSVLSALRTPDGPVEDDDILEALVAGTVVASHSVRRSNEALLSPLTLRDFLLSFLCELDIIATPDAPMKGEDLLACIPCGTVPYLSPPNNPWPDATPFLTLGNCNMSRPNDCATAVIIGKGDMCIEAIKDQVKTSTLKDIVQRMSESTKIFLVVAPRLHKKFFSSCHSKLNEIAAYCSDRTAGSPDMDPQAIARIVSSTRFLKISKGAVTHLPGTALPDGEVKHVVIVVQVGELFHGHEQRSNKQRQ